MLFVSATYGLSPFLTLHSARYFTLMVHVMASIAACDAANLLAALRRVRRVNRTGSPLTDSRDLQLMVQGHHPIEVLVVKVRFLRTHLLVAAKEPEGDLIDEAITDVCQCGTFHIFVTINC